MPARMAIMAITTSNSISVNAEVRFRRPLNFEVSFITHSRKERRSPGAPVEPAGQGTCNRKKVAGIVGFIALVTLKLPPGPKRLVATGVQLARGSDTLVEDKMM